MKILQINKFFYKKGGSELYLFGLRDLLKRHGHEVMDFSMHHEKNESSKYQKYFIKPVDFDGPQNIFKKIKNAFHLLYSFEAARNLEKMILEEGKPDVAHLHNFSYQLTPSIVRVLKKYDVPIVWTLHDYKIISPNYNLFTRGQIDLSTKPDNFFRCVKNRCVKDSYAKSFLAALEMFLHRKVTKLYDQIDCYVAPSKFLHSLVVEWGIPQKKVFHLYNFIDYAQIEPSAEHEDYYFFVGRFIEEKGVMPMLEAFALMPDRKLKIVGAGPLEQQMLDFLEHHQLPRVEMLGAIYKPQLYDLMRKAKAVIMPSVWLENNPLAMLDAMACGKPIIGSNMGGIPELIDEGKTGLIFDPSAENDLTKKIIELDSYDLVEMSRNTRSKLEKIANPEIHYRGLMEIYESVISGKRRQK